MSNLASVQKILKIESIPDALNIELAFVLGWQVVVKKNEFKVGDLIVYISIDTVVPEKEEFEFLRERKFRVRTIKLRKQLSQGLIIPLPKGKWNEGQDVTELIGVKKYEKPDNNPIIEKPRMPKVWYKKWIYLFKYNILYKFFPTLLPKTRTPFPKNLVSITDEERIQNIPRTLTDYEAKVFHVREKLDGSSITIIHNKVLGKSKFRICSRRFELHDKKNDWYRVFEDTNFGLEISKLIEYYGTDDIIVQGECIGKFNGNHHNLKNDEIRLFNIFVDGKRLLPISFETVTTKLNIPVCPFYGTFLMTFDMNNILKISEGPDCLNPSVPREGLVWRCIDDGFSFKVINNAYLISEK